ncbi:hypothetical protein CSKR_111164 [Clonorchis sinensis]|uniref:Uncharacterized protein n=1 Tax=Clonorchis sinensis TaxID=79923 RepID=A0A419Q3H3_CLOSI|nr:hypothetical protein CSKR_111164 [Clonorchis sinensis]
MWRIHRISGYRARLFPVAKAFSISRVFDVHQSSRSTLRLFTIWRLMDLGAPSYSLPAGTEFLWSFDCMGEVGQIALNAANITSSTFCHAASTCSLPVQWIGMLLAELRGSVRRARTVARSGSTESTVELQLVAAGLRNVNGYAESSYWPETVDDQQTTGGFALRCRLRIDCPDVIPRSSDDQIVHSYRPQGSQSRHQKGVTADPLLIFMRGNDRKQVQLFRLPHLVETGVGYPIGTKNARKANRRN